MEYQLFAAIHKLKFTVGADIHCLQSISGAKIIRLSPERDLEKRPKIFQFVRPKAVATYQTTPTRCNARQVKI